MSKLERLREALHIAELMHDNVVIDEEELRGLLKVCDEYIEAETFRLNESGRWYSDSETYEEWLSRNHKRAKEKLEELLG